MTAQISQETARKMMDALTPFANCVFNDNGDMTVSYGHLNMHDRCIAAYFALRRAESELKDTHTNDRPLKATGGD